MDRNAFKRSAKMQRTPPNNKDDSTVANPNVSSCPLCKNGDSIEMVQCDSCKNWHHFQCVGVKAEEIANVSWRCPSCDGKETNQPYKTGSVRSSTSSKRRGNLLLEKLAKEKAIAEKYAEDQKKILEEKEQNLRDRTETARKFVQEEFDIRDAMVSSDDEFTDSASNLDQQNKVESVVDWLNNPHLLEQRAVELEAIPTKDTYSIPNLPTEVLLNAVRRERRIDLNQQNPLTSERILGSIDANSTLLANANHGGNQNENLNLIPITSSSQNVIDQCPIDQNTVHPSSQSSPQILIHQQPPSTYPRLDQITSMFQQNLNQHPPLKMVPPMSSNQTASLQVNQNLVQQRMTSQMQLPPPLENQNFVQQPVISVPNSQLSHSFLQSNTYGLQIQSSTGQITPPVIQSSNYQPFVSQTHHGSVRQMYQPLVSHIPQPLTGQMVLPIVQSAGNQQFTSQTHQSFTGQIPHSTVQPSQYLPIISQPYQLNQTSVLNTQPGLQAPIYQQMVPNITNQSFMLSREQIAARQAMSKDLPKFKGEPESWSIFYNAFITSTATCGLTNGENLDRLQKCLGNPARKLVKNFLTQPEAVPNIIETLRMRYGRPEVIIESLIQQLRNETNPKTDKMEWFIDFAMTVRNVSSEIQTLGMWQYLHNPSLIQELVEKLPYEMRISWGEQKLNNPTANLSHFSDWLFIRARSACEVSLPPARSDKDKPPEKKSNNSASFNAHLNNDQVNKSTTSDVPKLDTNSKAKRSNSCQLCENQTHHHHECPKFLKMNYDERWEAVKEKKLCRRCLGNHHSLSCKNKNLCGEPGCPAKHHRLLHDPSKVTTAANENSSKKGLHTAHQTNKIVMLRRYIPVTLYGPNCSLDVLAFLDDGSDFTLVEEEIVKTLGIDGTPEELYLEWTSKIVRAERGSKILTMEISGHRLNKKYSMRQVRTVKRLDLPPQSVDVKQLKNRYKFLRRIPLIDYKNESPKIIIGLMDCKLSNSLKCRSGNWEDPVATKTLLGWEVHGSQAESPKVASLNFHLNSDNNNPNTDENLHQMVANFFSLENFGVKKPEKSLEATTDKRAKELLQSTTKRIGNGNKFEAGLLWKYDKIYLPDSLPMATRRLDSLCRRLERDPGLDMKFRSQMAEYVQKGYVRKLTIDEENLKSSKIWYLPLFPVFHPKKPTKIRLVWDAAAMVGETSLNSVLLKGPDQLVSLPGVLLRFREGPYAITGDIRDMFHRAMIRKEDQMAQRFLWKEKDSNKIEKYVLLVMSFGAACSPSTAQYIKNRNAEEFANEYPRAEIAIRQNHYVDDWLQSFRSEKELLEVAEEVKLVHSRADFDIRNWISNSSIAMSKLNGNQQTTDQKISFDLDDNHTERVLGMWWNVSRDTFTYSLRFHPLNKDVLTGVRRPTKREILRTLMAVYDPLGFLAPFLVQLKILLQDIWRSGMDWDEMIKERDDDNMYDRWLNWIRHLPNIERINIPRHFCNKINANSQPRIELHIFVDAGLLAYCTVAYLRIEDEDGVECSLVGGKTKVAPLKPLSVPRMELQAAVLGTRYKNCIRENLTVAIIRNVFWSDSSTVLSWLKSDLRKYSQYVGARVGEILESTVINEWRWVPTKLNPADDGTKWNGSLSLEPESRWFKGPDFLRESEEHWPNNPAKLEETMEERKPKRLNVHIQREVEPLNIKFELYHQWIRSQAFVLRFINNLKAKTGKSGYVVKNGDLLQDELVSAENVLFQRAQEDGFWHEIQQLKVNENLPETKFKTVDKNSRIYRYSPYLDQDGILRVRGRIDAAPNVSYNQKRPIILPTHHKITELVVKEYHRRYKHRNTETVVNEVKQRFMIPRLRALVKRIRRECQHCKNASAMPMPPQIADLPLGRLSSFTRPFTYVGVDYAGPYKTIMFRKTVKRWIVLFTCLTIRAVHLEYVHSLTTDSCIMAITRFTRKNGTVQEFFSDPGTNFVGTDNELSREIQNIDHEKLNVTFSTLYTKWNFHPPKSPHMGGAWERLIGSMKKILDEILPTTHLPNDETLYTALIEVQHIINSRPLTFVSIEPDDPEALTPNHFLLGSSNGDKPPGEFPLSTTLLRGNWRYSQQIANGFWHRWVKEYLPVITRRTKWFENVKPIGLHDQVIIVDETKPRNTWERGVIVKVIKVGRNGRASKARVRTERGTYTRPVCKLAVLDIEKPEAKILNPENLAGGSVAATAVDV